MNSTFLRVLATLMVIAAVATAYIGYRLSQKKPADTLKVVVPTYTHVIARNTLPAGHVLVSADLETATTSQFDKRSYSDPQALVGKTTTAPIIKGATFNTSYFPASSVLGQGLAANERAVAIKVNEVVGVGGFIRPGDHVDVLLYLHSERETGEISSAQVVLTDVKVLAYGTLTGEEEPGPADPSAPATPAKLGASNRSGMSNNKDSRSAILAVPAQALAKLMLADNTGTLRLALRGEIADSSTAGTSNLPVRLSEVSQAPAVPAPGFTQIISESAQAPADPHKSPVTTMPRGAQVIVHSGEKTEVIDVVR